MMGKNARSLTRREFVKTMAQGAALVTSAGSVLPILGCGDEDKSEFIENGRCCGDEETSGFIENGRYTRKIDGKAYRVFFGDLHVHSIISPDVFDPSATPDILYQYAMETTKLDFTAMTDHDYPPGLRTDSGKNWAVACEAAQRYHKPGRFVTFPAYEWTSGNGLTTLRDYQAGEDRWAYLNDPTLFGHRNVFFPSDNVPDRVFSIVDEDSDTPEKLWDVLKPFGAITIPHHPLGGPCPPLKWEHRNPEVDRLVEIYSLHGNSEADECPSRIYNPYLNGMHSVDYALSSGCRMGFIGSSDSHAARPGAPDYNSEDLLQQLIEAYGGEKAKGGGIAAVYAEELTRESIWDALVNRRTYTTTGEKIFLDLSADGHFMGSEFTASRGVKIKARAIGTTALNKIELLKNGEVLHTQGGGSDDEQLEFEDKEASEGTAYYYVRVTQEDGEMAWSSPVWVDYA